MSDRFDYKFDPDREDPRVPLGELKGGKSEKLGPYYLTPDTIERLRKALQEEGKERENEDSGTDSLLSDIQSAGDKGLTVGKYGLSIEVKKKTQELARERGIALPNDREMDMAGDGNQTQAPLTNPAEILERVVGRRNADIESKNNPNIKEGFNAVKDLFDECTPAVIYKIYRERFGKYPGSSDRIPKDELRILVDRQINQ